MALMASGSKARQNAGLPTARQPCLVEGRSIENEKGALSESKPYKTLKVQGQRSQPINSFMSLQREVRQPNHAKDSVLLESSPPVHRVCDVDKDLRSDLKPSTAAKQPNLSTKANKQPKTESTHEKPSTSTLPSSSSCKASHHRGRDRKRRRANKKGHETSWVYVNAVEDFSNPTRRDQLLKGFQSSSSDEDVIVPTPIVSRVVPDVVHPLPSSSQSKRKPIESSPSVSHIDEYLLKSKSDSSAYDSSPSSLPISSSTIKTVVTSSSLLPPPSRQLGRMESQVTTSNNYRPHLHALHRIRRERKRGLALDEDNFVNQTTRPRPSIVDREEMFHRFGEKEKEALSAFNFLDELYVSSCPSSPIKGLLDEAFPYTFTESPEQSPFKSYTWSKWTTRQRTRSRSRSSNRFSGDSFESPVLSPQERKLSLSALPSCYSVPVSSPECRKEQLTPESRKDRKEFQKLPSNQTSNDNVPFLVENTSQTDRTLQTDRINHQINQINHIICKNRRRLKDARCRSQEDEEHTNHDSTSEENLTWPLTWPSLSHDDTCTQWTHRKSLVLNIDQDSLTDDPDPLSNLSSHRDPFVSDEEGDGRQIHSPDTKDTKLQVSQLLHALEQLSFDNSSNSEGNVLEQRETDIM